VGIDAGSGGLKTVVDQYRICKRYLSKPRSIDLLFGLNGSFYVKNKELFRMYFFLDKDIFDKILWWWVLLPWR
jgi:hypothetical protein